MQIIAIRKITVQKSKVESVRNADRKQPPFIPPYQGGRCVHRKTARLGLGAEVVFGCRDGYFSKIDTYGTPQNRTYWAWGKNRTEKPKTEWL